MSTEQPWGSEPPLVPAQPKPRWSGRKTLAAVGIAVVIAAGGGAAIWAATAHDADQRPGSGGPGFPGGPGGPGGPGPGDGRFPALGALDNALHGEFVVADGSTELLQTGKVTQVSASSIDVTSTDGYAHSYAINNATRSTPNIKSGDQVTVIAKKTDNTALSILDRTNLPQPGRDRRPQPPTTSSAPPTT